MNRILTFMYIFGYFFQKVYFKGSSKKGHIDKNLWVEGGGVSWRPPSPLLRRAWLVHDLLHETPVVIISRSGCSQVFQKIATLKNSIKILWKAPVTESHFSDFLVWRINISWNMTWSVCFSLEFWMWSTCLLEM